MDEGHEPERIEIELTSHEPATRRTARVPYGATVDSTDPDELGGPGLLGTERGRLVAVGAAVAVIALTVGVLMGRLGSGDVATSDDTATTNRATTTTDPERDSDTLPRAPAVLAPTTTRPERTTTTTIDPEQVVEGSITINPVLTPEKVELIALTRRGALIRIDSITGATRSTTLGSPSPSLFSEQSFVSAGDGWILAGISDDRGGEITAILDDGSRSTVDLAESWPPLTTDGPGLWRAEVDQPTGLPSHLVGLSLDGSETGEVIELDGYPPQIIDPLGGVVVQAPGGYYALTPESRTRITVGHLHALGRRRAVVRECDARLECGFFVIDRDSGAREPLQIAAELETQLGWPGLGWWGFGNPLSPDEDAMVAARLDNAGPSIGVLDLSTGSYTELGRIGNAPQAAWGPAGRYLYWLDDGRIMVFDRSTGESVPFSDDFDAVSAVTVRSFAGSADDVD